jgi:4-amino-4-deoxy-L-arabinose transferase-like glycosyltransferase
MNVRAFIGTIRPVYYPYIAVVFSLFVLLAFWFAAPGGSFNQTKNDDYVNYYLPVGQNIADGQGITLRGKPALEYPPGFPIIVAAALLTARTAGLGDTFVMRFCYALFFAAGALLIYALARKLWGPGSALLAALLWSCYPVVLWSAKNPGTDLPFAVFLYAALLCTLEAWRAGKKNAALSLLAGAAWGMTMLIRPITIGLGVVSALLLLCGRRHTVPRKITFALCLLAGNLAAVAPWEAWAYSQTREIIPLSNSARASVSLFDGMTFAVWNPYGCRKGITVPDDVRALMTEAHDRFLPVIETTRPEELRRFMADRFRSHPVTVLKLAAIKIARSWYGTFTNRFETGILFVQLLYLSLLLWSCVLVWRHRPDMRYIVVTGAVVLSYFWGMTVLVDPLVRYMMPVLGALVVFFPAVPVHFLSRGRSVN